MNWSRLQAVMVSPRVRWGSVIAAVLFYIVVFILAFEEVGPILGAFAIFPVIVAGGLFGSRVGIIAGLLTVPLNTVLLNIVLDQSRWDILRTEGGFAGVAAITVIGGVVGYLHELNHRVQEAERERFFAVSVDMLAILTIDGVFTRVNPAFRDQLGYAPVALLSTPLLQHIHPEDQANTQSLLAALQKGASPPPIQNRVRCADGHYRWVEWSTTAHPEERLIYAVARDITTRKETEFALQEAVRHAEASSRMKSQLLATVSHELRTPLNATLGFAEMLKYGIYGRLSNEQQDAMDEIIESTRELIEMVEQVLTQAQLESQQLKLQEEPFTTAELLQRVERRMSILAERKGLELTTTVDPNLPPLLGDTERLNRLLTNLVNNAIKFTDRGKVRIEAHRTGSKCWELVVADTGRGIPPAAREEIFEPFRQVDDYMTREQRGTGLGLAIVNELVSLMDGDITLESEVGRGSKFTVSLPLRAAEEVYA